MVYTATTVSAEELQRYGSVYQVVPEDELMGAAWELAREIAEKSPLAVWGSKEMLNYGRDHSTQDTLKHMVTWQAGMWHMPDMQRAFKAQKTKTTPEFDDLLPNKSVI